MEKLILIKYGELTTKKDNRKMFVKALYDNISKKLYGMDFFISRDLSRMYIEFHEKDLDKILAIINKIFGKYTEKLRDALPLISVTAICLIVASVVSHTSELILSTGAIVFVIVILHNLLGYAFGFGIGQLFKMDMYRKKAVSIEIGMQNSGLATNLAKTVFSGMPMAMVPGAIFSVWHNISGAILAGIFRRIKDKL